MEKPPTLDAPQESTSRQTGTLLWMITAVLYLMVVGLAVGEYFSSANSKEDSVKESFSQDAMSLRLQYASLTFSRSLTPNSPAIKQSEQQQNKQLEKLKADALKAADKSEDGAAMSLFIATELGEKLPTNALQELKKSTDAEAKAIYEVYASRALNEERSEALFKELANGSQVAKLVSYHALRLNADPIEAQKRAFPASIMYPLIGFGIYAVGLALVGIGAWAAYFLMKPKLASMQHPLAQVSFTQSSVVAFASISAIVMFTIVGVIAALLSRGDEITSPTLAIASLLFVVGLVYGLKSLKLGGRSVLTELLGSRGRFGKNLAWGFLGYAANLPVLGILLAVTVPLIERFSPSHPASDALTSGASGWQFLTLLIVAAVVAPIWEELTFRGLLLGGLQKVMPLAGAVCLQGFIFAAIHPQGPALWLSLGWIGVMGALLTIQTRSIVPAIWMHAFHNATVLSLGYALS